MISSGTIQSQLQAERAAAQSRAKTAAGRTAGSFRNTFMTQATVNAPQSMDAIFEEAASVYNIPVNLLKSVAKAESGFNPNAVSPAGAVGVMQLMPATAKSLGVKNSYDARSNIMGGAKYLKENLDRYNGNISYALAAYNAGPNNVDKYGGVPPFKETQNYVRKIAGYMKQDLQAGRTVYPMSSGYSGYDQTSVVKAAGGYTPLGGLFTQYGSSLGRQYGSYDQSEVFYDNSGQPDLSFLDANMTKEKAMYLIEMMRFQMQLASGSATWGLDETAGLTV